METVHKKSGYFTKSCQLKMASTIFSREPLWGLRKSLQSSIDGINLVWESIYLDEKDSAYPGYDSNLDVVINNGRYNYLSRTLSEIYWYLDNLYEAIWPGSVIEAYNKQQNPEGTKPEDLEEYLRYYYTPTSLPRMKVVINNFAVGLPLSSSSRQKADLLVEKLLLLNGNRGPSLDPSNLQVAGIDSSNRGDSNSEMLPIVETPVHSNCDTSSEQEDDDDEFFDSHAQYETDRHDDAEPSSIHIDLSNVENVQHFGDAEGTRSYSDVQTDIESYYTISSDDDDDWEDAPEVNTSASVGNDTSVDLHPLRQGYKKDLQKQRKSFHEKRHKKC